MGNRDLPMMPWFPKDFAAATSTWSFYERSAYRALLDVQWEIGTLPADLWRLAQAIGMPVPDFEKLWPVISEKFEKVQGGIRNSRLEEHRLKSRDLSSKRASAGQAGGIASAKQRASKETAEVQATVVAKVNPPSPSPSPSEDKNSVPPEKVNPAKALAASMTLPQNGSQRRKNGTQEPESERVKRAITLMAADPMCTYQEAARLCHVSVDQIREARGEAA